MTTPKQRSIAAQVSRNCAVKIAASATSGKPSVETVEKLTVENYRWLGEFQKGLIESLKGSGQGFSEDSVQIEAQSAMNSAAELVASGYRLDSKSPASDFHQLTRQLYQVAKRVERAAQTAESLTGAAEIEAELSGYPAATTPAESSPKPAQEPRSRKAPAAKPESAPGSTAARQTPKPRVADQRDEQDEQYDEQKAREEALRDKIRDLAPRLMNVEGEDIDAAIDQIIQKDDTIEGDRLESLGLADLAKTINRMNDALKRAAKWPRGASLRHRRPAT